MSGNGDSATTIIKELLTSLGWRESVMVDLGDITTSRGTEMLLPLGLRLYGSLGTF